MLLFPFLDAYACVTYRPVNNEVFSPLYYCMASNLATLSANFWSIDTNIMLRRFVLLYMMQILRLSLRLCVFAVEIYITFLYVIS